jgi:phosphoglycolate phosphatase
VPGKTFASIIFDFDGTLTDSRRDIAGTQLLALETIGFTGLREEALYRHIGKTLQETFAAILPPDLHDRIPEAAAVYSSIYPERSLRTTTLFPGVRETLTALHRAGVELAVASTKRGVGIRRATDHFGITDMFVRLQGSDGSPFKPDPFILNAIIDDRGWDRARTVMVGDTDKDILAGKNAGIATCAVTYGSLTAPELRAFAPDFIIDTFPELLRIAALPS